MTRALTDIQEHWLAVEPWLRIRNEREDVSGGEALHFLMEAHGLRQSDLPEIGSQGVVSEIINGKRELNVRQIRALAKRFAVSPAVFVTICCSDYSI